MKHIHLFEKFIMVTENENIMFDLYEKMDENLREIYQKIRDKEPIIFKKINPSMYKKALSEFMRFGHFTTFPVKYIHAWKHRCINNIFKLNNLTSINGHGSSFDSEAFHEYFETEYINWLSEKELDKDDYFDEWSTIYDFLDDVYNLDNIIPRFSNGQPVLSDYGLELLLKLAFEISEKESPEEIIVVINKILDVAHQRSDLAELFITGGSDSLDNISNN